MTRVLHLFDGDSGWEQRVTARQLSEHLSSDRIDVSFASCGTDACARWGKQFGAPVEQLASIGVPAMFVAPKLQRHMRSIGANALHTWGMASLAAAASLLDELPVLHSVFDPGISNKHVKLLRTIGDQSGIAVICAAERVRRRLVERGVPFERCVVVRPAVDFAAIGKVNREAICAQFALPADVRLLVIPPPRSMSDGHLSALWAATKRSYLDESVRLLIPGIGAEVERIKAYSAVTGRADSVVHVGDDVPFELICVASDDLIIGDIGEISMTAAAWAMAANTLITAPATYATSEILANDLNARLFKAPENWRKRSAALAAVLDLTDQRHRILEVARGQAYEVFSLRRCARQHEQVIDNLLAGNPPADGVSDPALVGAA